MRKLFGTDGVRGRANKYPITAEVALKLGKAASKVLTNGKKKPVFLIGKDPRLSGYMLENALVSGLTSMGADVYLVGPMPTPAVAHLVRSFNTDAGIMISASHNPSTDNGIKFFDHEGYKLPDKIEEEIEKYVLNEEITTEHIPPEQIGRAYRIDDARGRYIEFAKNSINNSSLKKLKVVLDCANGAAYKVAPLIFSELGAEVIVLSNAPNGTNINKGCGALLPEKARAAVLENKADIGIVLDGDADRIVIIDEKGKILDGDFVLALGATYLLEKNKLNKKTVVTTNYSNMAFDKLIEEKGGKVVRVKNGDRYVIEKMREGNYNLGGEYTGHIIFSDYNTTGDGLIAGLQILRIMKEKKKTLSELTSILKKYPNYLVNVKVNKKIPLEEMPAVIEEIKKSEKILGNEGRHLIRYSGTESLMRIMFEGEDYNLIKKLADNIASKVKKRVGV